DYMSSIALAGIHGTRIPQGQEEEGPHHGKVGPEVHDRRGEALRPLHQELLREGRAPPPPLTRVSD
ncbi:hypothetical protein, partial [Providencia stuartii]|uniref:hypothetical protein n=1 Tax=Providencia stuartii TaxID=588 RepID=UPI001EF8CC32